MSTGQSLIATDIEEYLRRHEAKDLLRFITCGSVDDGKSSLIGRLLYDSKLLFEDQLAALESDSKKCGTTGGALDLALLVDGLQAEREQGITIDVAYRFFTTEKRKFIVADTPGHEQYTRNMATGASTAEVAVILIDARKGVLTQTRRHSYIVSLLGIRDIVLAVNKMDLVDYDQATFEAIVEDYRAFAAQIGLERITAIPLSALTGENVTARGANTPWYEGPALLEFLETVQVSRELAEKPFRLPVQWVSRPDQNFRGYAGTIASGRVRVGEEIVAAPGGRRSRVTRIVTMDGDLDEAFAGQAVTLTLADEIDISRGDVIAGTESPPGISDQFAAHLLWMAEEPLLPGRPYLFRLGSQTGTVQVTEIKHQVNVNTLEHVAAKKLALNEVAVCNISLDRPLAFDAYADNRETGGFIVVDRISNATVGCGMLDFELRRASNVHWQALDVDKQAHVALKGHKPCVLWFTGLSGSGKSTVANVVERRLHAMGKHTYTLDGDNVRHGLNKDLGFTDEDRVENIRRVAEVSKLFVDAGIVVLVSFISPFRSERRMARELMAEGEFLEVFIDAPLEVCESRDVKGLYKKAREGKILHFTGIDSAYEEPEQPEMHLRTDQMTPEDAANRIIDELYSRGII